METKTKGAIRIEKWLAKIGYSLTRWHANRARIIDNNGNETNWMIQGEDTCIEYNPGNKTSLTCAFYLKQLNIESIRDSKSSPHTCISFSAKENKSVFIQFYNHGNK